MIYWLKQQLSVGTSLKRTVAISFFVRVCSVLLALVSSIVLARSLGPSQYGIYAFVFALVSILALPAQVGVPTLVVRETAKAYAAKNWAGMKGLWRWSGSFVLGSSLAIAILGFVAVLLLRNQMGEQYFASLLLGLLIVPVVAMANVRGSALRGLRYVIQGQLPESIIRPLLLTALILLLPVLGLAFNASNALLMHLVAAIMAFTVGAFLLWRVRPHQLKVVQPDKSGAGAWLKSIVPLGLIGAMQTISNQTDIVMIGLFREEAEAGIYKVAVSGAGLTLFGLQVINIVISPRLAGEYAQGRAEQLQRMVTIGTLVSTAIALPVTLLFVFGGEALLAFVFGQEYVSAYLPLAILALGQLINAMFGSVGLLLSMSGHEKYSARWLALSTLVNIVLNLLLIPRFGAVGAAIATLISVSVWNIAFWRVAKTRIGIDASLLAVLRLGK